MVDPDIEVGVVSVVDEVDITEGNTIDPDIGVTLSVGGSDGQTRIENEGDTVLGGERLPLSVDGRTTDRDLLVDPRTGNTSVDSLRTSPLDDRAAHGDVDGADDGGSSPAAASSVVRIDGEG